MEKNNELKKISTYYYFNDLINIENFDFKNILLDEKTY